MKITKKEKKEIDFLCMREGCSTYCLQCEIYGRYIVPDNEEENLPF